MPALEQESTAVPIFQTATFRTADATELADVLTDRRPGYAYSRIGNPTATALADAIACVEGAEEGFAFGTGMAAIFAALASNLSQGSQLVASRALYGSTRSLIENHLRRFGVAAEYVDVGDFGAIERALGPDARVLYAETISNPTTMVADIEALAAIAHRHEAILVVDNTFASPYLCRPCELGADLVVESATKWIGGHSDVLAGVVCGASERIARIRAIEIDTGGMIAPFSAFLVLRGLETLAVRMERHSATALTLAEHLERREDIVARVYYPGLASHPQADLASRQLRVGGGMLAFDLGAREAGTAFLDALTIPERTASLGSVHTIATHPPSTTHRQLTPDELLTAGIAPGLVRMSVGLEDPADLLQDVSRGLEAARMAV